MDRKEDKSNLSYLSKANDVASRIAGRVQDNAPAILAQAADVTKTLAKTKLARTAAVGGAAGATIGFVVPFLTVSGMAMLGAAAVVLAKEIRGD